jgi:endonuclease YncB( thermonuclease family)
MRRLTPWVALLSVLVVVLAAQVGAQSRELVTSIADGDTLTVAGGTRVRLVQIDTPELGSGECYSRAARRALERLAPVGSTVRLEVDPALDQVDRYGRVLRYVRRGTMNVNIALVRAGAAAPYFYGGDRGRHANRLLAEATRAKAAKRGLWGACPGTVLDPSRAVETSARASGSGNGGRGIVGGGCDPSYTSACVPSPPPDLDCEDIRAMGVDPVRVVGADPHRLDGDDDGWGCE